MLNTNVAMMQGMQPQQNNVIRMPGLRLDQKEMYKEQSMLISADVAAEYSAIGKMNNIIADTVKEIKSEKDPMRIKLLEARISTLNNMIIQREARLNQMELALNNAEKFAKA